MRNNCLIVDFIQSAKDNGLINLWAYLPRDHQLIKSNKVAQIRKVNDVLAFGFDELGNRVVLTKDCKVVQQIA